MGIVVELTEDDLKVISAGISELPYKIVAPVMMKLQAAATKARTPQPAEPVKPGSVSASSKPEAETQKNKSRTARQAS